MFSILVYLKFTILLLCLIKLFMLVTNIFNFINYLIGVINFYSIIFKL